jgi:hypothetical protein
MRAADNYFPISTAADFSVTLADKSQHNMFHYLELYLQILIKTINDFICKFVLCTSFTDEEKDFRRG